MALANVSLEDLHTRCAHATFAMRASVIHEVHSRESLWIEKFGSFHNYILAHGKHVYGFNNTDAATKYVRAWAVVLKIYAEARTCGVTARLPEREAQCRPPCA
mmetsp:Transcript_4279/g.10362  ORF Transcript_4279/g.10362 Transcript_4279/m.10362 type:complete len:103 (+) Transcript_4279:100-408(+)